jgi:hypothetical protein
MKAPAFVIGVAFATALGLVMASNPALAQDPNPDRTRADGHRSIQDGKFHDGKSSRGGGDIDFAAARADADAKAKAHQDNFQEVKNKQKQTAVGLGLGIGGGATVDVKNKNFNTNTSYNANTLTTGDTLNNNINANKQILNFGFPSHGPLDAKPR